jgi:hypothetical protein
MEETKERVAAALSLTDWMPAAAIYWKIRKPTTPFLNPPQRLTLAEVFLILEQLEDDSLVESKRVMSAHPLTKKPYMRPVFRRLPDGTFVREPTRDTKGPVSTEGLIPKPA